MKSGWTLSYGILIGLLAGGVLVLLSKPIQGEPIKLRPVPTSGPIIVHISGQVINPGVYTLPLNSRIRDAVEAAGGLTDIADENKVNLAAVLTDGQKIVVPGDQFQEDGTSPVVQPEPGYPLDINTATQAELESLPGIGPVTAEAILAYREEYGYFKTVEELDNVPGIGSGTLRQILDLITIYP